MSTEAEQNRLIIENSHLVEPIAATFRDRANRKGLPFEDLKQEGMRALVQSARQWHGLVPFSRYALKYIEMELRQFVANWQHFVHLDVEQVIEDRVFEWQIWGILPSEGWTSLPATPEEIRETYELYAQKQNAVNSAMLSLTPRERKMIEEHFLRKPNIPIAQVARNHRVSYRRANEILWKAVKKMRYNVARQTA